MSDTSVHGFKPKDFGETQEKLTRSQMLKQFMDAEHLASYPQVMKKAREEVQRARMEARLAARNPYDDAATYTVGAFSGLVDE